MDSSPEHWAFHTDVYGLANVLLDRDGRVMSCHLPTGNGVLMAMADLAGIGAALGSAMQNMSVWLAVGVVSGVAVGLVMGKPR